MIASIPSPEQSVWFIGPFPLRAYAMFILAGIIVAVWITQRRLEVRGGEPGQALDVAVWAVPFGIVGGRIYHVISSPGPYFGDGGHPLDAFKIWQGGLGIWGAVALGTVGAWIGCRRHGVSLLDYADAAAPGVVLAQAIGRWGNYFNNELFGTRTDLPWGLEIHCWDQGVGVAATCPGGTTNILGTFQPTFLYESLWCLLVAVVLVLVDRRFSLARGQVFALYGILYTLGRGVIEMLRSDQANYVLGLRLNVWTSVTVFAGSVLAFWLLGVRASRESSAEYPPADTSTADEASINESHPSQHPD
ncbi:MAG: prolipoprotein diacylglyceryl transferase [Dermatophilaceae bacterium]|nr:prolipoprotein diacylglyceryl transferase [Dermatophilaceae bacterium]